MSEHTELLDSLNNAIAYSWVLGWYAGKDGSPTDAGKIIATETIKNLHPDIVLACNSHKKLLKACERAHDALLSLHVCNQDNSFADEIRTLLKDAIAKATD